MEIVLNSVNLNSSNLAICQSNILFTTVLYAKTVLNCNNPKSNGRIVDEWNPESGQEWSNGNFSVETRVLNAATHRSPCEIRQTGGVAS